MTIRQRPVYCRLSTGRGVHAKAGSPTSALDTCVVDCPYGAPCLAVGRRRQYPLGPWADQVHEAASGCGGPVSEPRVQVTSSSPFTREVRSAARTLFDLILSSRSTYRRVRGSAPLLRPLTVPAIAIPQEVNRTPKPCAAWTFGERRRMNNSGRCADGRAEGIRLLRSLPLLTQRAGSRSHTWDGQCQASR